MMLCVKSICLLLMALPLVSASESFAWSFWRGPFGNGSIPPQGIELIDDLSKAKLVWVSDQPTPHSYPRDSHTKYWCGGYCIPLVAEGRVYVHYWTPPGRTTYEFTEEDLKFVKRSNRLPYLPDPSCDDVIHCFDAKTGKTLWRTVFPGKGHLDTDGSISQMQACYYDGKVFAPGSWQTMYAVDAATGKKLWEADVVETIGKPHHWRRYGALIAGDGVVACPLSRGSAQLIGFDVETGEKKWEVTEANTSSQESPILWQHGGKDYVYRGGALIELATGRVCWDIPGHFKTATAAAIAGDMLVINNRKVEKSAPAIGPLGFKISPDGFEQVWAFSEDINSRHPAMLAAGKLFFVHHAGKRSARYAIRDLATGKKLAESKPAGYGETPMGYHPIAFENRLVYLQNTRLYQMRTDTDTIQRSVLQLGHKPATCISPTYVDGFLYMRTRMHTGKVVPKAGEGDFSRVVCYDLRK